MIRVSQLMFFDSQQHLHALLLISIAKISNNRTDPFADRKTDVLYLLQKGHINHITDAFKI